MTGAALCLIYLLIGLVLGGALGCAYDDLTNRRNL